MWRDIMAMMMKSEHLPETGVVHLRCVNHNQVLGLFVSHTEGYEGEGELNESSTYLGFVSLNCSLLFLVCETIRLPESLQSCLLLLPSATVK